MTILKSCIALLLNQIDCTTWGVSVPPTFFPFFHAGDTIFHAISLDNTHFCLNLIEEPLHLRASSQPPSEDRKRRPVATPRRHVKDNQCMIYFYSWRLLPTFVYGDKEESYFALCLDRACSIQEHCVWLNF